MSPAPSKVLCIGIDAASPILLKRWAADGTLPVFRKLIGRGLSGELAGVRGFFVGSTWPSMYSGMSPAGHGFHYLVQLQPGSYDFHHPADHGISLAKPFWARLSRAGKRVAVLDVPLTSLDPTLNGIQTVEWGGHDSVYGFRTTPSDLRAELLSEFGAHPLGLSCDGARKRPEELEAFVGKLIEGVRKKTELTCCLLRRGNWDLFMQVFTESHCVGHQCWHVHDPHHPAHDRSVAEVVGDPIRRVYQAIDRGLGEILSHAGEAKILVFSAHGMGHGYGAHFLLPEILVRAGAARALPRPVTSGDPLHLRILRRGWRGLPPGLRRALDSLRSRATDGRSGRETAVSVGVDFRSSSCFPVPNGLAVSGIRLNLRGREPNGILEPGQVDGFSRTLASTLASILNQQTGQPLIRRVLRTEELYPGDESIRLPDLLVEWDDTVPLGSTTLGEGRGSMIRAVSERIGVLEGRNDWGRSGEHRMNGWFVATGPGIGSSSGIRSVSVMDLAPTLARWLSVELEPCDGTAIPALTNNSSAR